MNSYNDVIDINKNKGGKKSFLFSSLDLKRPNSFKYSIPKIEEEKYNDKDKNGQNKNDKNQNNNPINLNNMSEKTNKDKDDKNKKANKNNEEKNSKPENKNCNKKNTNIKNKLYKNDNNHHHSLLRNINKKMFTKLSTTENSKTQKSSKFKNANIIPKSEKKYKPLSPIQQMKKSVNNINTEMKALSPKLEFKSKSVIQKNNITFSKSTKTLKSFNSIKSCQVESFLHG